MQYVILGNFFVRTPLIRGDPPYTTQSRPPTDDIAPAVLPTLLKLIAICKKYVAKYVCIEVHQAPLFCKSQLFANQLYMRKIFLKFMRFYKQTLCNTYYVTYMIFEIYTFFSIYRKILAWYLLFHYFKEFIK